MSPELEERIYQDVLRSVLWDEGREKIFRMLGVNGITGAEAEVMFNRAREERIAEIRGIGIRKLVKGGSSFFSGVGVLVLFEWFAHGYVPRGILILSGVLVIFGGWWLLDGFFTTALAGKKKGPIGDED